MLRLAQRSRCCRMVGAIVLICAFPVGELEGKAPTLTEEEARTLVEVALAEHNPKGTLNVERVRNRYDSSFLYFEAIGHHLVASPHIGNFAVNPVTGDVFDADGCRRLKTKALRALQSKIKQRSGLRDREFKKARARKPICSAD